MIDVALVSAILVMALATFATRVLPFALLYKVSDHPVLQYLGRYLPAMIMMLLVLYALKGEIAFSYHFVPQALGVLAVVVLHLVLKQPLISILGGTACYMALVPLFSS